MNAMPGPQFNQETGEKSWFRNNGQKIVLSLIVVLLAVGGFYFYKSYQERQALLKPALEEMQGLNATPSPQESPITSNSRQTNSSVLGTQQSSVAAPEVRKENSNIVARAAKGNGATHLARQSLKEYLKDKTDLAGQLKAEQKIYIEDYLQKHVQHSKTLKVGDEITFSDSLIQDAINQAQKLTDKQINNLHKYVLLAPSLN